MIWFKQWISRQRSNSANHQNTHELISQPPVAIDHTHLVEQILKMESRQQATFLHRLTNELPLKTVRILNRYTYGRLNKHKSTAPKDPRNL